MMDFGDAIRALKQGKRVARQGWNGKGMWLVLLYPESDMHRSPAGTYPMLKCIGIKTADNLVQPGWLASQTDMLAEDWSLVA